MSLTRPATSVLVIIIGLVGYLVGRRMLKLKVAGAPLPTVRKMAAITAIDEVIGRATEMNRPVHVPFSSYASLYTLDAMATMVGFDIWEYECKLSARLGTKIFLTSSRSGETLPVLTEKARQAYLSEGKMEDFDPVYMIRFQTGTTGTDVSVPAAISLRENVAADIMISPSGPQNVFPLCEAAMRIGAITIMGMTTTNSMPYLPVWGDYILIGEEVFAAGAYITKDPGQIGNLMSADIMRFVLIGLLVLGTVLATVGIPLIKDFLKLG